MSGATGVLCALPYGFNLAMARLAAGAGMHFTDLGGNTAIVEEQRKLGPLAESRGVSIVPDTGLAPGMVNVLAQAGIDALDEPQSVRLWVGGLPQDPKPPLDYQIVYSLEGMLDYYVTPALILRDGELASVEALSEVEHVEFPDPVGRLEAFFTGGGTSAMPYRYKGRMDTLEYKTLRYPGHARIMRSIRELGLLSDDEVVYNGHRVVPRKFFIDRATPVLDSAEPDMVVARVEVTGRKDGAPACCRYDVLDRHDPLTGLSAMTRTTGFSLAVTALMQARGEVAPGFGTPDEVMPAQPFVAELRARGIRIVESHTINENQSQQRTTHP